MKPLNSQKIQIELRNKFLKAGVKMLGPETIFFSKDTKIGKNVSIDPYVVFGSKVKIGNNVIIKSFSHLEACKIENKVEIGPYSRIRPDTILKEGSKIGNFVEVKKSTIGKKSKVNHLSYIGDTEIGKAFTSGLNEEQFVSSNIPLERKATAEEIAKTILYLVSDESFFMTGAELTIDGGLTAR